MKKNYDSDLFCDSCEVHLAHHDELLTPHMVVPDPLWYSHTKYWQKRSLFPGGIDFQTQHYCKGCAINRLKAAIIILEDA